MKNKNTIPGSWADINKDIEDSNVITASEIADTTQNLRDALERISQFTCEAQFQDDPAFLKAALGSVEIEAEQAYQKHVTTMNEIFSRSHDRNLKAIAEKEVAK